MALVRVLRVHGTFEPAWTEFDARPYSWVRDEDIPKMWQVVSQHIFHVVISIQRMLPCEFIW